jgi:hypothetical protein
LALGEFGISVFCSHRKKPEWAAPGDRVLPIIGISKFIVRSDLFPAMFSPFKRPPLEIDRTGNFFRLAAELAIQPLEGGWAFFTGNHGTNADFTRIDELHVNGRLGQCPEHLLADPRMRPQADSHH